MLDKILKNLVKQKRQENIPDFVIINFLKEYLQFPVLDFIYNTENYQNFIFTGGSCLRICYNLPRLSEDLDFDLLKKDYLKLNLKNLALKIRNYFKNNFLMDIDFRCQGKTRIYLKFPVLKKLNLSYGDGSNLLYVKIEPNKSDFIKPEIEITPISNFGFNFLVKNYNLKFLMTGKILAIFNREWFKGIDDEINIKGRDFYDIFWYFKNNISSDYSNLSKFAGISNERELKKRLWEKIDKNANEQKLSYDLKNFFGSQNFISNFCKNYKEIMKKYLLK
jgi:predicted nucleotidyltransferase component of viral defense system